MAQGLIRYKSTTHVNNIIKLHNLVSAGHHLPLKCKGIVICES